MTLPSLNNITNGSLADANEVNQNFDVIADYLSGDVVHADGSVSMTGELLLANSSPSVDLAAASKGYVDAILAGQEGDSAAADSGTISWTKFLGWVFVMGDGIGIATYSAILPADFRPADTLVVHGRSLGYTERVTINTSGDVNNSLAVGATNFYAFWPDGGP